MKARRASVLRDLDRRSRRTFPAESQHGRPRIAWTRLGMLAWLVVGGVAATRLGAQTVSPPPADVVDSLASAFNRHDVSSLDRWIHSDFVWVSVDSVGARAEVEGLAALRSGLEDYFRDLPTVSVRLEGGAVVGPFVSVVERVSWTEGGEARSQASVAVYQVEHGKVRRVWYYPAVR